MLQCLELFGFKSFADKTRFDFAPGITGVVGPNGSGKSNVVDALKWILGDQSPKSLRGKEMTDVIFNGSSSRKPSAFSEATISFDNSSGFLGIDSAEVHIGRRLWRNGESEYLINRAPSRLKDVKDLLMGTGAGTAAYSIIEQGRVDQILQANPTSRRAVFEEAAGISKFKSRKVDAQRKLERVEQNLLRLKDIVEEVGTQLTNLRTQAAKAAKYREISEELRQWWQGFAADEFHELQRIRQVCEADAQVAAEEMERLNAETLAIDQQAAEFEHEINRCEDRLREVESRRATVKEAIAGREATVQNQFQRLAELDIELQRLGRQQHLVRVRVTETAQELAQTQESIVQSERTIAECQQELQNQSADREAWVAQTQSRRDALERDRKRRIDLMRQASSAEHAAVALQSQMTSLTTERETIALRLSSFASQLAELNVTRSERQNALDEVIARQQSQQAELQARQSARRDLQSVHDDARTTLATYREQRSAALARKGLLEDLELRQEGLGIGAKEILSRARTSKMAPWNTVLGTVADLFEVDLEQAAMLEAALGNRTELIVLSSDQPMIDYLQTSHNPVLGRVGFLTVSRAEPEDDNRMGRALPDLSGLPGVVSRGDAIVSNERGVKGLAARVLADTWIVETLDHALALSRGAGRGLRFVTLAGEVIEPDGAMYVGTERTESGAVSRKSELRRIKQDLLEIERQIAEQEAAMQGLVEKVSGAEIVVEERSRYLLRTNDELVTARALLAEVDQRQASLLKEQDQLLERETAIAVEVDQVAARVEQLSEDARETANAVEQLDNAVAAAEHEFTAWEEAAQHRERSRNAAELQVTQQQERRESLRRDLQRLLAEQEQRALQQEEADRRYVAMLGKRSQVAVHWLNTSAELADCSVRADRVSGEVLELAAVKADLRRQKASLSEADAKLRKRRRELQDKQHQLELRLRDSQHQLEVLEQRLQEEDQLTLDDVAKSGASAFRLYLQEQGTSVSKSREHEDEAHSEPVVLDEEVGDELKEGAEPVATKTEELTFADVRGEIEERVNRLRRRLKSLGHVNTESLKSLEELEERFTRLSAQLNDLVEAKATLEDIIRRINVESRRLFAETFETIRTHFQELFRKVFGGGFGDLVLEDPEDVLECGIDVKARPPGKELRSLSLLSGGEKTMTAIALILAIFRTRPSPFCILDEVDAALDEANVERFTNIVKEMGQTTQIIMITHHKRSMVAADVLYGVTMEESGISKRMSVRFDDLSDDGHIEKKAAA